MVVFSILFVFIFFTYQEASSSQRLININRILIPEVKGDKPSVYNSSSNESAIQDRKRDLKYGVGRMGVDMSRNKSCQYQEHYRNLCIIEVKERTDKAIQSYETAEDYGLLRINAICKALGMIKDTCAFHIKERTCIPPPANLSNTELMVALIKLVSPNNSTEIDCAEHLHLLKPHNAQAMLKQNMITILSLVILLAIAI